MSSILNNRDQRRTTIGVIQENLLTRLLLLSGVLGPSLFTVVYMIEGATRPGYNPWLQAVSSLSLSDQGWMQVANFILSGLLVLGFALGLRRTLCSGEGAMWGPALIAAAGTGLILAGVFVTDPSQGYPPGTPAGPTIHPTWQGNLHFILGAIPFFLGLPAAVYVILRRFGGNPNWRGWETYSIATIVFMVVFFIAFMVASLYGGPAGLFERLSITIGLAWIVSLSACLLSIN